MPGRDLEQSFRQDHADIRTRPHAAFNIALGLERLEFPRTEVQHFGNVAIVWSSYVVDTEIGGKLSSGSSRVTEIFVWQDGRWINPGWHTDEEK